MHERLFSEIMFFFFVTQGHIRKLYKSFFILDSERSESFTVIRVFFFPRTIKTSIVNFTDSSVPYRSRIHFPAANFLCSDNNKSNYHPERASRTNNSYGKINKIREK